MITTSCLPNFDSMTSASRVVNVLGNLSFLQGRREESYANTPPPSLVRSFVIINTYRSPSRLFTCGREEILSQKGTTQGDPLAMPWYVINTSILIQSLRAHIPEVKQVLLANDSAGGGPIELLYNSYKLFSQEGKKFGYLVNGSKSWLIVKPG